MNNDSRFRIKNWDSRQSLRSDVGGPGPWIKIYKTILSNRKIAMMSDAEFGRLVKMWLLAAMEKDTWGELPEEPDFLRKVCMMDENPDLQLLEKLGLIESVNGTLTERARDVNDPCPQYSAGQGSTVQDKAEDSCSTSEQAEPGDSPKVEKPVDIRAEECCRILASKMVGNDPKVKLPKTEKQKQTWISDMEKIHRIDDRPWPEITAVILWCQADGFWRGNILSPGKLRKQFTKLLLAKDRPAGGGSGSRAEDNKKALANVLEEMKNESNSNSTDGLIGDLQRADGSGQDQGIPGGSRRIGSG